MMQQVSLRRLVGTIGLSVAITTAVVVPFGFFYQSYAGTTGKLTFLSRLNAARVAQYIYSHSELWQYQRLHLIELIQLPESNGQPLRQIIYDKAGHLVLEEGEPPAAPVASRSAPIVVVGATVGRLIVQESLRESIYQTALVGLLSSLLGLAAYFALRIFPLRVLDQTLGALHETEASLRAQNARFDAALTNMSQGLCLFGADGALVIFNKQFAEIYGLSAEEIRHGMTAHQLMALAFARKSADANLEESLALQQYGARERKTVNALQRLTDGRSISISQRSTPDGGLVVTFEDITERLSAQKRIEHLAQYDALTDLPNRVTFYERIETMLNLLQRSDTIAVFSLDLDHFKSVNDTLGHPVGDLLLKAAAGRMQGCIRSEDFVARLGGDEFAIVQAPSSQPADVTALARRLIEVIGAPYDLEGHQVVVGASIGIAISPGDGKQPDVLMKNADLALYRAKADGGGVYRFFETEMDARMQARRVLELDLRKAVVNGEFELYYQPIINVKTKQITNCEALIRWHHPKRGMVPPMEFIPVAEETGLIVQIGEWVLRQACMEAVRWPKEIVVSVNVSPVQFKSHNMVPAVVDALKSSGLAAGRLALEITELVLIEDSEAAFAILHQLHDIGIKIAMDDFGTGYSSLGYLRSFPFDKIKIDQSFIRDLPGKEGSVAIVRAVVGLSSSLGITTTAEGVETAEQLASLTAEGCDEVQGFLFSRGQPAAEVARMLDEQAQRTETVS
jgi:diguanylate cyclase (GGDEF)-like protein/PAS domain S-box-containing protein